MVGKFNTNHIKEFRDKLAQNISYYIGDTYIQYGHYDKIDNLLKLILLNNGCKISDQVYGKSVFIMDETYGIYFVIGAIGNDINKIYDLVDIDGMTYLVIFLDAFNGIDNNNTKEETNGITNYETLFGKSNYFMDICKLVDVFIKMISNPFIFANDFSTTAIANNYRYIPYIIAGYIFLTVRKELTEDDIEGCGIPLPELLEYIYSDLSLYGIRKRNEITNEKNNV